MDHVVQRFTSEKSIELLNIGNRRRLIIMRRHAEDPERGPKYIEQRKKLTEGQHPFAIIVSCSDSRFPPEIIFANREGDLFVVRTAGHVIGSDAAGSIEYAVEHLNVPLIVVMGHDNCGAVTAAVNHTEVRGHVFNVLENIFHAVEKTKDMDGDKVSNAIDRHIIDTVKYLKKLEPVCKKMVEEGRLKIIGARCPIDSYEVKWLTD